MKKSFVDSNAAEDSEIRMYKAKSRAVYHQDGFGVKTAVFVVWKREFLLSHCQ